MSTPMPKLKYLDVRVAGPVGGRGNAARLFFLANKMPFKNELVKFKDWNGGEKDRFKTEGDNPLGHLPVLEFDGKIMPETISIARYMARKHGLYGEDADADFETDAMCDAHQEWRNEWAKALFGDDAAKEEYKDKRDFYYGVCECYYQKKRTNKDGPYMVKGDVPGFADTTVFNMMRDDQVIFGDKDLTQWPAMQALYTACDEVPEIRKWISDWESRDVEKEDQ